MIAFGHVGQEVARRAKAFGLKVQAIRSRSGPEALRELLATSDFVVVACPLTRETKSMLIEERLRLLNPNAIRLNVARAEIVEKPAVFEAPSDRWSAAAALDIWYRYPAHADERLHGSRYPFHELPTVFATPHTSAWTAPIIARHARQMAANLDRFARGEPLERVVLTGT